VHAHELRRPDDAPRSRRAHPRRAAACESPAPPSSFGRLRRADTRCLSRHLGVHDRRTARHAPAPR
jgi:hypothetical protein